MNYLNLLSTPLLHLFSSSLLKPNHPDSKPQVPYFFQDFSIIFNFFFLVVISSHLNKHSQVYFTLC
jgi:hypothetical protein